MIEVTTEQYTARFDAGDAIDLSHCLLSPSPVSAFALPDATEEPVSFPTPLGRCVLDTRKGGNVNCSVLHLATHGNGTHTECVGHIAQARVTVPAVMGTAPWAMELCLLLRVEAEEVDEAALGSGQVPSTARTGDRIVTQGAISKALQGRGEDFARATAVVVCVEMKETTRFSGTNPPYFTPEATEMLSHCSIQHLLVNVPSLDREEDGGELLAHKAFFQYSTALEKRLAESDSIDSTALRDAGVLCRTVTELCRIPAALASGTYMLHLQLMHLASDAVPSRPMLFPLHSLAIREL